MGARNIFMNVGLPLLGWFEKNRRDLPWRADYSPYQVWISEIMLQQTQVKTMLPFYFRWMERFPDAASIAVAPEDEVLRYWEGLGYYARAKNIQKAARIIVSEFEGKIPRDFDSVRKLPGVGRYTAGAIMSVAFNADYPAADANAARVFARIFDISHPSGSKEFQEAVWRHASEALPEGRSRDFNQALMDLGSMVCLGREPVCAKCPISRCCGAFRAGTVGERPVKSVKKPATPLVKSVGVWLRDGKVLVRKRPGAGLMPNLWEFPGGGARDGEGPEDALRRVWLEELGVRLGTLRGLAVIKHSHTSSG